MNPNLNFGAWMLYLFLLAPTVMCQSATSGPVFIQEPPNQVDFSNTTGTEIVCQSRGFPLPQITWVKTDGSLVKDVPGLRQVMANGNLVLPPFRAEDYNQEVHAQTYRCIAQNPLGKIQSRDVHVRAVAIQEYQTYVNQAQVIRGNDVIVKCDVPSFVADFVVIVSWQDNEENVYQPNAIANQDGKYVVLPSGELQIRNVGPEDGFKTYKCRTKHRLTGETKLSATAGRLVITEPIGSASPKFSTDNKAANFERLSGSSLALTCSAQGFPLPAFRWYKFMEMNKNKKLVKLDERVKQVGGTLIIREAMVEDSGKYLCMVNNSVGGESVETVLTVTAPLSVEVEPKQQVVDYGRPANFKCNYKGNPVKSIGWMKNGEDLGHSDPVLRINSVKKEDRGMYQCFVRNDQESAQATGELKLGGRFDPPEFVTTFETQNFNPGKFVSLSCIAKGDPSPDIKWYSYGTEVVDEGPLTVGSFKADNGDVVSHLNITQARTKYGGIYDCVASSKVGSVTHTGKLNIFGAPFIRKMDPMKVVAGKSMSITCPVAGYPVSRIVWERDGRQLPFNDRQIVFPNGTLVISDVQRKEDAATYTCMARNDEGYSARSDLEVSVMELPRMLPLSFGSSVLNEGSFAQLSCVVSEGDEPLTLSWSFHGHNLTSDLGISTTDLGARTSILMIPSVAHKHVGNYTCKAINSAGYASNTAELKVNVRPRWTVEPTDKQFAQGSDAKVDCKADGFPQPQISWKKAVATNNQMRPTPNDYHDLDVQTDRNVKIVDGTLIIKNIQKSHEGFYLCKASNGIGGISAVAKLSVQAPPSFEIKKRTQTALISENTVLQCEAKGEKPIGVLWNKDNKRLDANVDPRYTIREEIQADGVLSTISIKRTERGDSALFTCVATNAFGSDDTSINLIIQEKPETPYGLKVLDKSGRTVKLSWQAPYNGNSNLTRYVIEFKTTKGNWKNDIDHVLVPGDQTMAGVFSLRPATSYHFRIVAQNEIGGSSPSDTVTIETAEESPGGPPVDIRVAAVDQHTLRVSWKPPLREHWNGDILGYYVGYKKTVHGDDKPYLFETVEFIKDQGHEHRLQISNLDVFTEYAVVVQAFNKIGQGPMSDEVLVHTAEGAPTMPPEEVSLNTLSSTSIKISWASPPTTSTNGVIQGYKVIYGPSKTWYDPKTRDTKISADTKTELNNLAKYTNYTVQVLAYTNGGDGVQSEAYTATTEQDIPGSPSSVKALAMSDDAILISWQYPEEPNGVIIQYTVYIKELDRSRDVAPASHKVNALQMSHQVENLNQKSRYEFWVTAHTAIGEGAASQKVTLSPTSRTPAKIASFDNIFTSVAKQDIKLPCIAVGNPSPQLHWKMRGQPIPKNDRIRQLPDGSLQITRVVKEDGGTYTCMVKNKFGQDQVTHELIVNGAPDPPEVTLTAQTTDSVTIKIKARNPEDKTPIHGYTLHYKPEFGDWDTSAIPYGSEEFSLDNLLCGQKYHLYVVAYNEIGIGEKTEQVSAKTKGSEPTVPDPQAFLEVSAGSVTLHLNAWTDGGCPILYFVVEYKPRNQKDWTLVSNSVKAGGNFVVLDLNPATWYNLKVTAHNNAGFSVAEYEFATLTVTGERIGGASSGTGRKDHSEVGDSPFPGLPPWVDLNIIVPVAATVIVICVGVLVICVAVTRKKQPQMTPEEYGQYYGQMNTNGRMMTVKRDGLPYEEMGYCPPPNRKLPPVPGQHSNYNTIDRIKNVGGSIPNGEEDISPYATFHLLGMREESKGGMPNAANFQTLPSQPGMPGPQTGPNTPAHQRHTSQTMNPRRSMANTAIPNQMSNSQYQQAVYDQPNCDYNPINPINNFKDQNFGNPYDCPENMYGGSMMSSVGYSQVSDYTAAQQQAMMGGQQQFIPPVGGKPLPGMVMPTLQQQQQQQQQQLQQQHQQQLQQQMMMQQQQAMQQSYTNVPGNTGTVIYKGGNGNINNYSNMGVDSGRGPLPHPMNGEEEDDAFPPPPPMRVGGNGNASADNSLNDSNSTTQSNVTSECSEAECDREPLVKQSNTNRASIGAAMGGQPLMLGSPKEMTTEEMRKLLERNEVINPGNAAANLQPYDTVNV